jgi:hypothetical protein
MKEFYLKFLNELKLLEYAVDDYFQKIENLELLVPIVGEFSAGKSSAINLFLDREVLPVGITPETSLATEIRYSENEYIEAIQEDGVEIFKIEDMQKIKERAKDFKHLRLFLNNEKIKAIEPLILVDMPGFDSPVELHNKAILNYLAKGVYFIVLMSVEKGNISKRLYKELELISEFRDFSFCLSKTNLKPKEEIEKIREYVKEQLEDFDYDKEVYFLNDKDKNSLNEVLKSIDIDKIYQNLFSSDLEELYFKIESEINTKIATLKSTKDEAKGIIKKLNQSIEDLKKKKEEMVENLKNKNYINVESIISKVINEILKREEFLIELALKKRGFEEEINDILRNVLLIELRRSFEKISRDVIEDFRLELRGVEINEFLIDENWIKKISTSTENFVKNALNGLEAIKEKLEGKNSKIYKTISSILAITTNIINPIIEVILVFLPDILNIIFKSKQEEIAKEKIKEAFHTQIIPKIRLNLQRVLPEIINRETENIINAVSEKFEREIREKKIEIEETLKEKEEKINKIEDKLNKLQNKKEKIIKIGNLIFKEKK